MIDRLVMVTLVFGPIVGVCALIVLSGIGHLRDARKRRR